MTSQSLSVCRDRARAADRRAVSRPASRRARYRRPQADADGGADRGSAGRHLPRARRSHARAHPRRARAGGALRVRHRGARGHQRVGRLAPASAPARHASRPSTPGRAARVLRRRRSSHSRAAEAGPHGQRSTEAVGRRPIARDAPTCPVCELHAESTFKIEGMDCHEEVAILERRLKRLAGLEALDADVIGQRLRIKYDAAKLSAASIAEAVAQTGMRAWLEHEEPAPISASTTSRQRLVALSGAAFAAGLFAEYVWHAAGRGGVDPLRALGRARRSVYRAARGRLRAGRRARHQRADADRGGRGDRCSANGPKPRRSCSSSRSPSCSRPGRWTARAARFAR